LFFENEDIPLFGVIWDDVDANDDDDATEEEEELARPNNSPSFNARTRFDEVARRIIFYVLSLSLSDACAWCCFTRLGSGIK
jgi:hypothetical protein|tara:strand:+ start:5101 stop:5346 length:246 start_codon:yes stop_codon:yes gene_type:complete